MKEALLVIDVQKDFCAEEGLSAKKGLDVSNYPKVLKNIQAVVDKARKRDIPIIFIKSIYGKKHWPKNVYERYKRDGTEELCSEDSPGSELMFDPKDNKIMIKHLYDGFSNPELEKYLKDNNIEKLFFAGFYADGCVDTTMRSAFMKGFYITAIKDAIGIFKKATFDEYKYWYNAEIINTEEF
ncbi:cysteine hydrolase [Candidatus Woesearchaeota archaeon]|nr:cysteine hydrolase [Candidatus Woesearchaeota archaeon]